MLCTIDVSGLAAILTRSLKSDVIKAVLYPCLVLVFIISVKKGLVKHSQWTLSCTQLLSLKHTS